MTMTSNTHVYASGAGIVKITLDGRRVLLTKRQIEIHYWEEIAFKKAELFKKACYVVEDRSGKIYATSEPQGVTILRVCPCFE